MKLQLLSFFLVWSLVVLIPAQLVAQTTTNLPQERVTNMKDGVFRQNGQMLQIESGNIKPLEQEVNLGGTRVQPDGTVIMAGGKKQKLREGYAVNKQGNIVITKDDMFTAATISKHAREKVGGSDVEFVVTDGGTTIIDGQKRQEWAKRMELMEKKMALLDQMMDLQAQKMQQMTASADLKWYDDEIRELNTGIEQLNQKLSTK